MRSLSLLLPGLLLLSATSVQTQTTTNPAAVEAPGVAITRISCRQDVFIPALYEDPMRANQDQRELERDQKATNRENTDRAKQGQTPIPTPPKKIAANTPVGSTPMGVPLGDEPAGNRNLPSRTDPGGASKHYIYKATIQNTGVKTIRTVVWQYLLFDPQTDAEVGRHLFLTKVNVRAGRSGNLIARSRTPPARVLQADKPSKQPIEKPTERVVIDRIEYDDGTLWQRSPS